MGATLVWDNEQMVPYAYLGDQWVGFDDPRSFKVKVSFFYRLKISIISIFTPCHHNRLNGLNRLVLVAL